MAEVLTSPKGSLNLSAHLANWEMLAYCCPLITGIPLNIITKRQSNKKLNDLINSYRSMSGNHMIETGITLKEVFMAVKKRLPICFLVDQAGNPDYSVYVDFFGRKAAAFSGPAKLALAERPLLILIHMVRNADLTYTIFHSNIEYDDINGRDAENVEKLTARIQKRIEEAIKEHPEQWLWFHKRFKHVRRD